MINLAGLILLFIAGVALGYFLLRFMLGMNRYTDQINELESNYEALSDQHEDLLDKVKEVIFRTDLSGNWTFINQAWTQITGYTIEETLQTPANKHVHPNDLKKVQALFQKLRRGLIPLFEMELQIVAKDETNRWIQAKAERTYDDEGNVVGYSGILSDITESKTNEDIFLCEMDLANAVQQPVLPPSLNKPGITLKGFHLPSKQLSGDMYMWTQTKDDGVIVVLIDIMGHGLWSSIIAMYVQSYLNELLPQVTNPIDIMKRLNRHLYTMFLQKTQREVFATGLCLQINPQNKELCYVNAGHPSGVCYVDDYQLITMDKGGITMGIVNSANYEMGTISYKNKVRALMFTDGMYEIYGMSPEKTTLRVEDWLRNPAITNVDELIAFVGDEVKSAYSRTDDISVIGLEAK